MMVEGTDMAHPQPGKSAAYFRPILRRTPRGTRWAGCSSIEERPQRKSIARRLCLLDGEICGLLVVSVASGKGGILVLEPTEWLPVLRSDATQRVAMGARRSAW